MEAERLGREAVERSLHEEDPIDQANAQMDLGHVLRLAGRHDEATLAVSEALSRYETKGNVISAVAARQVLADLGPPPPAGSPGG